MNESTARPAWLTTGGPAALVTDRTAGRARTVTRVTIQTVAEKSFTTVTADGDVRRWTFNTHQRGDTFVRSLGTWEGNQHLMPVDHPTVALIARESRVRRTVAAARVAFDAWAGVPTNGMLNDALVVAIATATGAAADLAAFKEATR